MNTEQRCIYVYKYGQHKDQSCVTIAKDGRSTCNSHNPIKILEKLSQARAERAERASKLKKESPGPCQSILGSGLRKGKVCGRLIHPGDERCPNHNRSDGMVNLSKGYRNVFTGDAYIGQWF